MRQLKPVEIAKFLISLRPLRRTPGTRYVRHIPRDIRDMRDVSLETDLSITWEVEARLAFLLDLHRACLNSRTYHPVEPVMV